VADDDVLAAVELAAETTGFSGVVQLDCADHTVFAIAAGLADRRLAIPNTPSTRFAAASATKGFTALAVMSLVADGTLDLDAPVRALLGDDLSLADDAVTLRQLLAHRSGIGDYFDEEVFDDINDYAMPVPVHTLAAAEDYLTVLGGHPQRERPGEAFRYNNAGYVVLAIVAERASGRRYHDLVDERVVMPAGLEATSFERTGDMAIGYLHPDGLRTNVLHLPVLGGGDGGIASSTDDVHRLWRAVFDGRVVPDELRRAMTEPVSQLPENGERYGLGFWLHPTRDDVILEGFDAGISFRSIHDPQTSRTLTVMSNTSSGTWPVVRAAEEALGLR
jgi:CubicO group peptidase (beta-lactamase class C family)